MKSVKTVCLILAAVFCLCSCANRSENRENETSETDSGSADAVASYRLCIGSVISTDSSTTDAPALDVTVASLLLDEDGKIVLCRLDAMQGKVLLSQGSLPEDAVGAVFASRYAMGDNYGMGEASSLQKEWYAQADRLASYVVGMNADAVSSIATKDNAVGMPIAADETLLSGCTITIGDLLRAIRLAFDDAGQAVNQIVGESALSLELGSVVEDSSVSATTDSDGKLNLKTQAKAKATDRSGQSISTSLTVSTAFVFNKNGEILSSSSLTELERTGTSDVQTDMLTEVTEPDTRQSQTTANDEKSDTAEKSIPSWYRVV